MAHPDEGMLRRLVDEPAGVSDPDRQHVATCTHCLVQLAAVRDDASLVGAALTADHETDEVDVAAAWLRLSSTPASDAPRPTDELARPARIAPDS